MQAKTVACLLLLVATFLLLIASPAYAAPSRYQQVAQELSQAIEQQADVTDGDLIYRGQSQWWITVENGLVTKIEEQYSP